MTSIFKAYDIRGIYPSELDESVIKKIGNAFVMLLRAKKIVYDEDIFIPEDAIRFVVMSQLTLNCIYME